jgi:capsular polysaccharide biosynthesis protein
MLNPDIVARLRERIQSSVDVNLFEGFHIGRSDVPAEYGETFETLLLAPAWRGDMRPPEKIFGKPADASCLNEIFPPHYREVPEVSLATIADGRIIGNNTVIGRQGQIFTPSPCLTPKAVALFLRDNSYNHQGMVAQKMPTGVSVFYARDPDDRMINQRGLFLHNLEPANYGSFLFRQLPQMLLLKGVDIAFDCYIVPDRTPWLRDALMLAGLPERPIFTVREISGCRINTILVMNEFDAEGYLSKKVVDIIRERARAIWVVEDFPRGEKLYVSRRLSAIARPNYRRLINEGEVEAYMMRLGFTIVYPEILTLHQQIAMFRQARFIVGPSGSGMLNAIFSHAGTRVLDMESFHQTVRQHAKLYASTEKVYSFLFGKIDPRDTQPKHFSVWRVPMDVLAEGVNWLLS